MPTTRTDRSRSPVAVAVTGLRTRIVLGYVGLLLVALAIATVVTRQLLISRLAHDIDQALVQEVEELRLLTAGTDPGTGRPFGTDVRALLDTFLNRNVPADHEAFFSLVGGQPFLASFDAPFGARDAPALFDMWATTVEPTWGDVDTPAGPARFLSVPVESESGIAGVFVAAYFPAVDRAEIGQVVRIIAVVGAVVLAVSAALAWSLAGRVLRPVRTLTRAARRVSETDLSHRIPVEGRDELAELGTTFNAMLDRLDEGFTGQRQFLDDVAHELRTPITIVSGHLELLGDELLRDETLAGNAAERADTIALINDELGRMNRYVNDLLLLAKAEQGDLLRPAPFDLGELVEQLLARVGPLGQRQWTVDAAPRPGTVAVVADEGRVAQAMLNLASNAVQHTGEGDEIAIGAWLVEQDEPHPALVRLWVRDTGPGIDEHLAEQLFQRRFRGAASRASRSEGMGIGLSIVDAIARAHGGSAGVANCPGGGAQFTITIPAELEQ